MYRARFYLLWHKEQNARFPQLVPILQDLTTDIVSIQERCRKTAALLQVMGSNPCYEFAVGQRAVRILHGLNHNLHEDVGQQAVNIDILSSAWETLLDGDFFGITGVNVTNSTVASELKRDLIDGPAAYPQFFAR